MCNFVPTGNSVPACTDGKPINTDAMDLLKIILTCSFLGFFLACGDTDPAKDFGIVLEGGTNVQVNEEVGIRVKSTSGQVIDSIVYSIDGIRHPAVSGRIIPNAPTLGSKTLEARIYSGEKEIQIREDIVLLAERAPEIYTYELVGEYPHDRKAFTQGLEFHGDTLYESTGRKGASTLRKVDFRSGEVLKSVSLEKQYFGEGLTVLNDTVYMLTWQEGTGFLFDKTNLGKLGSFKYGESKEGWGLCNDGERLYKSDGTQRIWLLDPATLREEGYIEIVTNKSMFNKANELEFVNGKIYANVWQKESMMIIDAGTGAIEGVVNFGGLKEKVTPHKDLDVFNGVAYHPGRQTFFVTGKHWDKLFEVRILKRD